MSLTSIFGSNFSSYSSVSTIISQPCSALPVVSYRQSVLHQSALVSISCCAAAALSLCSHLFFLQRASSFIGIHCQCHQHTRVRYSPILFVIDRLDHSDCLAVAHSPVNQPVLCGFCSQVYGELSHNTPVCQLLSPLVSYSCHICPVRKQCKWWTRRLMSTWAVIMEHLWLCEASFVCRKAVGMWLIISDHVLHKVFCLF